MYTHIYVCDLLLIILYEVIMTATHMFTVHCTHKYIVNLLLDYMQ